MPYQKYQGPPIVVRFAYELYLNLLLKKKENCRNMLISFLEMKRKKSTDSGILHFYLCITNPFRKVSGFYSSEEQGEKILIDPSKGMRTKKSW